MQELDNGKILVGDVGTGKSLTAAAYYVARESPRDIYVITTAKKRDSADWVKEFARLGVGTADDATFHGVLHVDSWNNIARYVDVKDAFFVFDEQRVVGSGAWTKSFYKIAKANRWILLSATPGDIWFDYVPVFVANGFYKNKTEFVREHVVYRPFNKFPVVERYVNPGKLVRLRNQLLVEMPMVRHTTRHLTWMDMDYDKALIEEVTKKRWNVFESRPLKDVAELFRVARKVVNSDASRIRTVTELTTRHPRLIVFYNFNYELELLRGLLSGETAAPVSEEHTADTPVHDAAEGACRCFPDCETASLNDAMLGSYPKSRSARSPKCESRTLASTSKELSTTRARNTSSTIPMASTSQSSISTSTLDSLKSPQAGSSFLGRASKPTSTSTRTERPSSSRTAPTGAVPTPFQGKSFEVAEWNGQKHDPVPTSERWVYLVQYTAGSEGWNCTTTNAMVMYSLTYSYKQWHQAFGRIDRMDTKYTDLYYYAFVSKSWIDLAIRRALKLKKNFNERSSGVKF